MYKSKLRTSIAMSAAIGLIVCGCANDKKNSRLTNPENLLLLDYVSIKSAEMPALTDAEKEAITLVLHEANFNGRKYLGSPQLSLAMSLRRSAEIIEDHVYGAIRSGRPEVENESESIDQWIDGVVWSKLRAKATWSGQSVRKSETEVGVKASGSGSIEAFNFKEGPDSELQSFGSVNVVALTEGTMSREIEDAPTQFDVTFYQDLMGKLSVKSGDSKLEIEFADFGTKFKMNNALKEEFFSVRYNPLGDDPDAAMDWFGDLMFCRGELKIGEKVLSCGAALKVAFDQIMKDPRLGFF